MRVNGPSVMPFSYAGIIRIKFSEYVLRPENDLR